MSTRNQAKLHDLTHSPVGLWQLDGSMKEESGGGYDLTLDTGAERYGMGAVSDRRAAYFNGSTILARTTHDAALLLLGDVTLEALVFPTATDDGYTDIQAFHGGPTDSEVNNTCYQMGVNGASNNPFWSHENGAGANNAHIFTDVSLPLFTWTHVAMVRDDTAKTVTLYLNGVATGTPYTYVNSATGASASRYSIGGFWPSNSQYFNGSISSCKVVALALKATEVLAEAQRTLASLVSNMEAPALLPEVTPDNHASITLWHRADQNDTDDGDTVTTPTLLAGANGLTQATPSLRPLVTTAGGEESWRVWDGAALRYFSGATSTSYISNTPRYHVYIAFILEDVTLNDGNPALNHRLLGSNPRYWGVYARRLSNTTVQVYGYHYDASAKITPHTASLGEVHLLEMWFDAVNGETVSRLDGGPEVRAAVVGLGGSGTMELGNSTAVTPGHVHEVVIANDEDPDTRAGIRNYFANRYLDVGV